MCYFVFHQPVNTIKIKEKIRIKIFINFFCRLIVFEAFSPCIMFLTLVQVIFVGFKKFYFLSHLYFCRWSCLAGRWSGELCRTLRTSSWGRFRPWCAGSAPRTSWWSQGQAGHCSCSCFWNKSRVLVL